MNQNFRRSDITYGVRKDQNVKNGVLPMCTKACGGLGKGQLG